MKKNIMLCLTMFLGTMCCAQLQKYYSSTVRIAAQKSFGDDIGTGIIIGQEGDNVFILTAFHVVQEATDINVMIYKQKEKHIAELVVKEEELDIAILKMETANISEFQIFHPASANLFKMEEPIKSIGHPAGGFWKLNSLNKIQEIELYEEERQFSITPQAVAGGCSGGPVFCENGAWLGMVTETSMVEGKCVKSTIIQKWIRENKIPSQYVYYPEMEMVFVEGKRKKYPLYKIIYESDYPNSIGGVLNALKLYIWLKVKNGSLSRNFMSRLQVPSNV